MSRSEAAQCKHGFTSDRHKQQSLIAIKNFTDSRLCARLKLQLVSGRF